MAGNPLVSLGTINIVRAAVQVPSFPNLNVTASFLGKGGVTLAIRGPVTTFQDALTGRVTIPEPYVPVGITINLMRSQGLAAQYLAQLLSLSTIGNIVVIPDSSQFPNYSFSSVAIETAPDQAFSSGDASYNIVLGGTWNVNSALWDLV